MKNSFKILSTLTLITIISGCQINLSNSVNNKSSSSNTASSSSVISNSTTSSTSSTSSEKNSSSTNSSSSILNESSSISSSSSLSVSYEEPSQFLTISSSNYKGIGSYDTGNYETYTVSGVEFAHYRAIEESGLAMKLLPYASMEKDNSLAALFYNIDPIIGIRTVTIKYMTENSTGEQPLVRFGNDKSVSNSVLLPLTTSIDTYTIDVGLANYFKIETNGYELSIQSIEIGYTNNNEEPSFSYLSSGTNQYRLNPTYYSGTLVSGSSSVCIPTSTSVSNGKVKVEDCKTYTYYSYDDVVENPTLAEKAAYTTPEDVAAYFIAFDTYPANYVLKKNYNTAYNYFGENTRCVSTYTRTDGYAQTVPWATTPGKNYPTYYELDIALVDYSKSNRGVGRVVIWQYGFDVEGYDDSPAAVYTDDHYATFQEYLNTGVYGTRFNAEMSPTNYVWGTPASLTVL